MVLFMFFCLIFEFIMLLILNRAFDKLLVCYNWLKERNDYLEREKKEDV